nr:uncharacterized protein LOC109181091 [Ipomoea batatas]
MGDPPVSDQMIAGREDRQPELLRREGSATAVDVPKVSLGVVDHSLDDRQPVFDAPTSAALGRESRRTGAIGESDVAFGDVAVCDQLPIGEARSSNPSPAVFGKERSSSMLSKGGVDDASNLDGGTLALGVRPSNKTSASTVAQSDPNKDLIHNVRRYLGALRREGFRFSDEALRAMAAGDPLPKLARAFVRPAARDRQSKVAATQTASGPTISEKGVVVDRGGVPPQTLGNPKLDDRRVDVSVVPDGCHAPGLSKPRQTEEAKGVRSATIAEASRAPVFVSGLREAGDGDGTGRSLAGVSSRPSTDDGSPATGRPCEVALEPTVVPRAGGAVESAPICENGKMRSLESVQNSDPRLQASGLSLAAPERSAKSIPVEVALAGVSNGGQHPGIPRRAAGSPAGLGSPVSHSVPPRKEDGPGAVMKATTLHDGSVMTESIPVAVGGPRITAAAPGLLADGATVSRDAPGHALPAVAEAAPGPQLEPVAVSGEAHAVSSGLPVGRVTKVAALAGRERRRKRNQSRVWSRVGAAVVHALTSQFPGIPNSFSAEVGRGKQVRNVGSHSKNPVFGSVSNPAVPTNKSFSNTGVGFVNGADKSPSGTASFGSKKLVRVGPEINQPLRTAPPSSNRSILNRTKHKSSKVLPLTDVKGTALHAITGSKFKSGAVSKTTALNGKVGHDFGSHNSAASVPVGARNRDQGATKRDSRSLAHGQTQSHNKIKNSLFPNSAQSLSQNMPKAAHGPYGLAGATHLAGGTPTANVASVGPKLPQGPTGPKFVFAGGSGAGSAKSQPSGPVPAPRPQVKQPIAQGQGVSTGAKELTQPAQGASEAPLFVEIDMQGLNAKQRKRLRRRLRKQKGKSVVVDKSPEVGTSGVQPELLTGTRGVQASKPVPTSNGFAVLGQTGGTEGPLPGPAGKLPPIPEGSERTPVPASSTKTDLDRPQQVRFSFTPLNPARFMGPLPLGTPPCTPPSDRDSGDTQRVSPVVPGGPRRTGGRSFSDSDIPRADQVADLDGSGFETDQELYLDQQPVPASVSHVTVKRGSPSTHHVPCSNNFS